MKSKTIRNSAKGEECTLRIAGVCNYDKDTTVLCHVQTEGGKMGGKEDDEASAVYGCSACHDAMDGRVRCFEFANNKWFYIARALVRTRRRRNEVKI